MRNERERFGLVERERKREKIVFSKTGQMFVCLLRGPKKPISWSTHHSLY